MLSGYWLDEDHVTIRYNDYGQAGRVDMLYGAGGHVVIINNTITAWQDPARLPQNQDHP